MFPKQEKTDSGETGIDGLLGSVRKYLYLPEDESGAFIALMGAVAATMVDGYPVWLVLTGPPGCGKTILINSLLKLPGVHECSDPTGAGAFLSGVSKKERSRDASGGILRKVGRHGAILMNDLTSILSKDQVKASEILGVIRECYSGRYTRPAGTDGGMDLSWHGKLGMFGGCTNEIDKYQSLISLMGERWLYYRISDSSQGRWAKGQAAIHNSSIPDWEENLRYQVSTFFSMLDYSFNPLKFCSESRRDLTTQESNRILHMSDFVTACRSNTSRDKYTHDIMVPPEGESLSRIGTGLSQLLVGLELIGTDQARIWKVLGKVAMDSMPLSRRMTVQLMWEEKFNGGNPDGVTMDQIVAKTGMSVNPLKRMIEDMERFKVVDRVKSPTGDKTRFRVSDRSVEMIKSGWWEVGI